MGIWQRVFGREVEREQLLPLYQAVIAEARRPEWYLNAGVPDTIDGRFDMVALVLSFVLIRLEREGQWGREEAVRLTELFIDDMDGQVRESGFGDLGVGKQVGKIMSALGGRLGAYRGQDRRQALLRNLYRGREPGLTELTTAEAMVGALEAGIAVVPRRALIEGRLA